MAQDSEIKRKEIRIQIPIFFKLMISMLFVATIPIFLLGIVSMGGTASITASLGLQTTIILLTVVTLAIVLDVEFLPCQQYYEPDCQIIKYCAKYEPGRDKNIRN